MQDIRSQQVEKVSVSKIDRRRDLVFLSVLGPFTVASFAAFFFGSAYLPTMPRTVFLLAPMVVGSVWLAYEQMHDLVWWNMHPQCPTCRRAYTISQRPRPGTTCPCCDTPLYPLQTTQDYKVIVLATAIVVVGLPIFALWASLVSRLA